VQACWLFCCALHDREQPSLGVHYSVSTLDRHRAVACGLSNYVPALLLLLLLLLLPPPLFLMRRSTNKQP
jgi:hypothetical protein